MYRVPGLTIAVFGAMSLNAAAAQSIASATSPLPQGDNRLVAAQIVTINTGETVSAIVRLGFRTTLLAGLFGHTTQSALAVTAAAPAAVLGVAVTKHTSPQ